MGTPYTESKAVDFDDLEGEVDFMHRSGVQGMVWPQMASEYSNLTEDERMQGMEVIAKASTYIHYANGNKASQAVLDPEIVNDPTIYPDEATLEKLFTNTTLDAKTQRLFTRTWTRIVTGQ